MSQNINQKLQDLEELKALCISTETQITSEQDDNKLIDFLKSEYPKLPKSGINSVLKLVEGKKPVKKVSAEERKSTENKLIAKAFLMDINPIDKQGKFVGYEKLRHRIAQKKNILKAQSK